MTPRPAPFIRRVAVGLALALALAPSVGVGQATSAARERVTGVELALEGQRRGPRGGSVTWLLTTYEVVGLAGLRPAPGAQVRVVSALSPGEQLVEARSDARGRLDVRVPIPDDAPAAFGVLLLVRTGSGVQRRFELAVEAEAPLALELRAAPGAALPGSSVEAFGRLARRPSGRAEPDAEVVLELHDARGAVAGPVRVRSDASGVFHHRFRIPSDTAPGSAMRIRASVADREASIAAEAPVEVVAPASSALRVALAPSARVVRRGAVVPVEVVVRRSDGRPVEGAELTVSTRRPADGPLPRTDARGRAEVRFRAPEPAGAYADVEVVVDAVATGVGRGRGTAGVRVVARPHAVALSVEGGALVPGVEGAVFAHVVAMDGAPLAGADVVLEGPRLGPARAATTDGSGIARFEVALGSREGDEGCGGAGAVLARLAVRSGDEASALEACLPVDLEAAARVRVERPRVRVGTPIALEIRRAPSAARAPVALALFRLDGDVSHAIHQRVVDGATSRVELPLADDSAPARYLVRVRPLVGREREEVRGGVAVVDVVASEPLATTAELEARSGRVRVRASRGAAGPRTTLAVALPIDEAYRLYLAERAGGVEPGDGLLRARLAAAAPADLGAPAVLRDGRVHPLPEPEAAEVLGLLRDPWRTRDRFVEGRLGLVFRAIEAHVEASVPGAIDDVGHVDRGRHRFNDALLRSLPPDELLGPEGATGLGGELLSVRDLEALDPAFDFDAVARRVTRERLFGLLLALRELVHENGLELDWARRGEPTGWLASLVGRDLPTGETLEARHLTDGWGRPFAIRAAARPRFARLVPVPGFEIVSAGPDGRPGTADDLWDPTARVLPPGSLYAEAVGEARLVARLSGVELGRATLALARDAFGVEPPSFDAVDEGTRAAALGFHVPPPIAPTPDPLGARIEGETTPSAFAIARREEAGAELALALPDDPRAVGVVVRSYAPDGGGSVAFASASVGAPIRLAAELPDRLRTGEVVDVPIDLVNLGDEALSPVLEVVGGGSLAARAPEPGVVPPGESRRVLLRLSAGAPGEGSVAVAARLGGSVVARKSARVAIGRGALPMRQRASGIARGGRRFSARLEAPRGALAASGRVLVFAAPALADDPDLAELAVTHPSLVGWAHAMAGRALDPVLAARIERLARAPGADGRGEGALALAAAIGASPSIGDDARAASLRSELIPALGAALAFPDPRGEGAGALRMRAAVVAALASQGASDALDRPESSGDALARMLVGHLPPLRRALRDLPGEPTLLARAAAALLLAHPRDGHGLAMLDRALEATVASGGAATLPAPDGMARDEALAGTLALAIAAYQAGREDDAARLLRGAARHTNVLGRTSGELAFWYLAAGAYGLLGTEVPESVEVAIDGRATRVALEDGRAVIPLPDGPGAREVRVSAPEGAGVVAAAELLYALPFEGSEGGPLALALDGDEGAGDAAAALELTVRASEAVARPIVELELPSGAAADDLRRALSAQAAVRAVEPRAPGFLRIRLAPIAEQGEARLALPLELRLVGAVRGLGAAAYPESEPERLTVLPPRALGP